MNFDSIHEELHEYLLGRIPPLCQLTVSCLHAPDYRILAMLANKMAKKNSIAFLYKMAEKKANQACPGPAAFFLTMLEVYSSS
jgi:hypothetical protein